jgi:hypothetical protein
VEQQTRVLLSRISSTSPQALNDETRKAIIYAQEKSGGLSFTEPAHLSRVAYLASTITSIYFLAKRGYGKSLRDYNPCFEDLHQLKEIETVWKDYRSHLPKDHQWKDKEFQGVMWVSVTGGMKGRLQSLLTKPVKLAANQRLKRLLDPYKADVSNLDMSSRQWNAHKRTLATNASVLPLVCGSHVSSISNSEYAFLLRNKFLLPHPEMKLTKCTCGSDLNLLNFHAVTCTASTKLISNSIPEYPSSSIVQAFTQIAQEAGVNMAVATNPSVQLHPMDEDKKRSFTPIVITGVPSHRPIVITTVAASFTTENVVSNHNTDCERDSFMGRLNKHQSTMIEHEPSPYKEYCHIPFTYTHTGVYTKDIAKLLSNILLPCANSYLDLGAYESGQLLRAWKCRIAVAIARDFYKEALNFARECSSTRVRDGRAPMANSSWTI